MQKNFWPLNFSHFFRHHDLHEQIAGIIAQAPSRLSVAQVQALSDAAASSHLYTQETRYVFFKSIYYNTFLGVNVLKIIHL